MSFGIMSHSALCRIRPYVVRLCVVRGIVARPNVVGRNVVRHNVGVSSVCGADFVQFLALPAVLPRSIWKNRTNSTVSSKQTEAKQLAGQVI